MLVARVAPPLGVQPPAPFGPPLGGAEGSSGRSHLSRAEAHSPRLPRPAWRGRGPGECGQCLPGCIVGGGYLHTALVGSLPAPVRAAGLPCTCPSVTLRRRGPGPSSPSAPAPRLAVGLGEGRPAALVFPGGLPRILVCANLVSRGDGGGVRG